MSMRPSWPATIELAIGSPSPAPWMASACASAPRKNRSKSCAWSSGPMPIPESTTLSTASSPSMASRTLIRSPAWENFTALVSRFDEDALELVGVAGDLDRLEPQLEVEGERR